MAKKILLIEDENFLADMYKMKFQKEGYEVSVASDGATGIEKALMEKPDLVFLDLVMPKMDGYQVLKKLRGNKKTKNLKIYILSNLAQNKEVDKGLKEGADGYLLKADLTPAQLIKKTKEIFANKKINTKKTLGRSKNGAKNNSAFPVKNKNNKKILIIEDEEDIANIYKMRLEKEGYGVTLAKNGAWGLKLAKENKFNIILLDMVMPVMNGTDVIKKLKTQSETKNTPIIVLSNSAQDEDINKAKKIGAAAYLLKSQITPAKLVKEIKTQLK